MCALSFCSVWWMLFLGTVLLFSLINVSSRNWVCTNLLFSLISVSSRDYVHTNLLFSLISVNPRNYVRTILLFSLTSVISRNYVRSILLFSLISFGSRKYVRPILLSLISASSKGCVYVTCRSVWHISFVQSMSVLFSLRLLRLQPSPVDSWSLRLTSP